MRPHRISWMTFAAVCLSFAWFGIVARGDQPPDRPQKDHLRAAAPDTDDPAEDLNMSGMGRLATLARLGRLEKALEKARGRRAGLIDRLRVAEILDAADEEKDDEEAPAGGQAETSIAVDSTGQHIVIGFNDTRGFALNPVSLSGFMYSDDGGLTFADGGQLPSPGADLIGATRLPQVFGDPEVKYLGGSTFAYFSIVVKKFSATGTAQTMGVHRSTDYGHTWQGPFEIPAATNPHGLLSGANARDAADKELADVDPDSGRVMMSWSNFTSTTFAPGGVEISTTFSDNLGTATPPTWSSRRIVAATSFDGQGSIPRFAGTSSSNVYVAWQQTGVDPTNSFLVNRIALARSTDNGATFGAAMPLTSGFSKTMDYVLGNDRVHSFPSLAVDRVNGIVYIVNADNANNDGADIVFQRSLDSGATFSDPVRINSRPGADRPQWFPWVTVDNSSGRVYVFYYDQRIPTGDVTQVSVQTSDDSGVTWSRPKSLADRPFHAGYGNDTGQPNLGDYNQAVAQNGELFAVFAATTPVPFTDGQPSSASMTTPDVVFKRVSGSALDARVALQDSWGRVTFTEPHNAFIDPGDAVDFSVPIVNYVTNPMNASTISGISATLSTSTPGVSIVNGTRSYPDIPPLGFGLNTLPFTVQMDQTFVPGTPIEFSLAVNTADGSTTLPFTQATGTPIPATIFTENFNAVTPGTLPAGWATSHAGGANTVPWTTNNTFLLNGSNAAFHQNLNDAVSGSNTRFERLFSPSIIVPATAEYVTLDFDVKYDTEDDPNFNVLAYDGFLLRITDLTPLNVLRSVQVESFAEEFTTTGGGPPVAFYPKHMPRNNSTAYLQDLSAWAGFSNGIKHVRLKLPGMAGRTVQMRWEYTQDSLGICTDVRPGHACGVAVDNIVMQSVVASRVVSTSTTVSSSQNASDLGEPITFTASVTAGTPVTTGVVTFKEGATVLSSAPVDLLGHAAFVAPALSAGTHTITAEYSDGAGFAPSSGSIDQVVDPLPSFTINAVSIPETNSGVTSATFTVSLSAPTHSVTAQVDFATADGTATTADSDYAAAGGTLWFAPGETSHTLAVSVFGDSVFEADEAFVVNLSGAAHASVAGGEGIGTIVNDDGVPAISIGDVVVTEGNAGVTSAVFTVVLSNPSSFSISVDFGTSNGTADAGSDYAGASGTVHFAPLEISKTIVVFVNGDVVIEPTETFEVRLSHPSGATISDDLGVGTIQNDDTVSTTLGALVAQVTACAANLTSGQCQALFARLAATERDLEAGRVDGAVHDLEQFIKDVGIFSGVIPGAGNPPRLNAATAAIWIAEAQSVIWALAP